MFAPQCVGPLFRSMLMTSFEAGRFITWTTEVSFNLALLRQSANSMLDWWVHMPSPQSLFLMQAFAAEIRISLSSSKKVCAPLWTTWMRIIVGSVAAYPFKYTLRSRALRNKSVGWFPLQCLYRSPSANSSSKTYVRGRPLPWYTWMRCMGSCMQSVCCNRFPAAFQAVLSSWHPNCAYSHMLAGIYNAHTIYLQTQSSGWPLEHFMKAVTRQQTNRWKQLVSPTMNQITYIYQLLKLWDCLFPRTILCNLDANARTQNPSRLNQPSLQNQPRCQLNLIMWVKPTRRTRLVKHNHLFCRTSWGLRQRNCHAISVFRSSGHRSRQP